MKSTGASDHLNTIVGEGTSISGELLVSGSVRIDGEFRGTLSATGHLTVGQNGTIRAEGTIHCQSAHIAGKVFGDLVAPKRVHLTKTATLNGNITTQVLIIEEGAVFNGRSEMGGVDDTMAEDQKL